MKKNLIFIVLFFLVPSLYAQKVQIGLLSGVNFPNLHSKLEDIAVLQRENKKQTLNWGAGFIYNFNKYINIRSEIFYEERGWVTESPFTINPNTGESELSKLDYFYPFITLPILAEGKIGRRFQLFLNSGINTSLRIGGKLITENGNYPTVFIFPEDKKPTFDFAWIWGTGLRIPVGKKFFLQTEYRYYRSWTPIGVGYSVDSVIKHKGYLLHLSGYFQI